MKVFITYSSEDELVAKKVADTLKAAGLDAWYDKYEIMPGENWAEKIAQGLKESTAMVVLLTPNALKSDQVGWSIDYALGDHAYNWRLIPVLLGSPEEFQNNNFPWILRRLKSITLPDRGNSEEGLKQIAQALKEVA
ncbi:MAG: hypothetical protein V7641_3800 [Blastocatellia bacterium]